MFSFEGYRCGTGTSLKMQKLLLASVWYLVMLSILKQRKVPLQQSLHGEILVKNY
jgi:hypothetical protein